MSLDGAVEMREDPPAGNGNGNGAVTVAPPTGRPSYGNRRLRLNPNTEHKPERYDDLEAELDPSIFRSLERHLPPSMLEAPRDSKVQFMKEIIARYLSDGERTRRHKEYRQKIMSAYQPLHKELYNVHPTTFFVPSFVKAINENTEESFRNIMSEPSPKVYTFAMLQPTFCELLLDEVENFERWVDAVKFKIMRPNTMNKYGAVLDDFGLEAMLNKLMEEFICPISKVFFPEVGGSTLDSHHGFVVEYGKDKDVELGFHVDDSEVTLNICLGKQFSGGELFFRGVRCDKHVNSETQPEEIFDYSHVPGQAVLHRGRHRHGARATTSGHRINLLLWCRRSKSMLQQLTDDKELLCCRMYFFSMAVCSECFLKLAGNLFPLFSIPDKASIITL
ncbi:2-oxoglutarate and iron-dependent oxygenase domain-containing protein CP2-like isoform X3 [Phoenix dactylifera]|uniref:2-oxoglutarate and iron-dependent oxygenase domain-containing protein CP2-like isoform X3 n=1 Tax=Phoenix dactylifera TaxID=42345 RepID=A0A8B8J8S2_PHODC|nr:2-oxoglutarate and iron-dependent oxygenase domain-containing protein CP2-like isoform X3 [Phoenix dactylifera]